MIRGIVKWCLLKIRGSSGAFAAYVRADSSASCMYFGECQNNIYSQGNMLIKHFCWKNVTGFQVEKSLSRSEVEIRNLKTDAEECIRWEKVRAVGTCGDGRSREWERVQRHLLPAVKRVFPPPLILVYFYYLRMSSKNHFNRKLTKILAYLDQIKDCL